MLDYNNTFFLNQSTASGYTTAASPVISNVIDLGTIGDSAWEAYLEIQIEEAFVGATSVITFTLQTDTVENFASPTTVIASTALPVATLVAGYSVAKTRIPQGVMQQYARLTVTIATANITAGQFSAALVNSVSTAL